MVGGEGVAIRALRSCCAVARAQHLGQKDRFGRPPRGWLRPAQHARFARNTFAADFFFSFRAFISPETFLLKASFSKSTQAKKSAPFSIRRNRNQFSLIAVGFSSLLVTFYTQKLKKDKKALFGFWHSPPFLFRHVLVSPLPKQNNHRPLFTFFIFGIYFFIFSILLRDSPSSSTLFREALLERTLSYTLLIFGVLQIIYKQLVSSSRHPKAS